MPRQFDLLVFDWDGTLMDSAACIVECLQAACSDVGLPVPSEDRARYVIGLGLNDAMAHVVPDVAPSEYPRIVERYRHHFLLRDKGTALFPGAEDMLRELHESGHLLAVATGKGRRGLDRVLETTGVGKYFHKTRCADEGFSKPHPGMLQCLMDDLGVDPSRTLMIGDTTHDMEMAKAAGVARLAVSHGAHQACDLLPYEPLACVENCAELRGWLSAHA
jgi:phosphoglycolate phosphatase